MTTHLPILSAPSPVRTAFCGEVIPLDLWDSEGNQLSFFVDGNSKITAGNGTYADPRPNAFSLPAASVERYVDQDGIPSNACPGSTSICRASCYVKGLAKHAPDLYHAYKANDHVLRLLFATGDAWATHAADVLAAWIRAHAPAGFRWHVSGDVQSIDHADWIAQVCERAPAVPFWIYTRTLEAVPYLMAPNLALNISADRGNLERARRTAYAYGARLCYLSDDGTVPELPEGSVIFPDYPLRGRDLPSPTDHAWWAGLTHEQRAMVCGVDFFGQSENMRCGVCTKCLIP